MDWFWKCLIADVVLSCVVYGIAVAIQKWFAQDSPEAQRQGVYVMWWVMAGVGVGGTAALALAFNDRGKHFDIDGPAYVGLGAIAGAMIGNIHGSIAELLRPEQSPPD